VILLTETQQATKFVLSTRAEQKIIRGQQRSQSIPQKSAEIKL